jgi:hypothetical protein
MSTMPDGPTASFPSKPSGDMETSHVKRAVSSHRKPSRTAPTGTRDRSRLTSSVTASPARVSILTKPADDFSRWMRDSAVCFFGFNLLTSALIRAILCSKFR